MPILPLFVFITLNFLAFGNVLGFLISWFFTCVGCFISYLLFKKKVSTFLYRRLKEKGTISKKTLKKVANLRFDSLVTIIAIPFTPAFLVNIICGLADMGYKKFVLALLLGKVFLVYFWGFVGVSLVESLKNPIYLIRVIVMLGVAYVVSRVINSKFKIE